jgi:hypothetical protein
MQAYETVICHEDTKDISIEDCKQIASIALSEFD